MLALAPSKIDASCWLQILPFCRGYSGGKYVELTR